MVHDECYHEAMKSHGGKWSARAAQQTAKCRKRKGIVKKSKSGENLKNWEKEKWKDEKGRPCGSGKKGETVKCRPSKRISKKTPVTWDEIEKTPGRKKKVVAEKKKVGMGAKTSPIRRKTSPTKRGSPVRKISAKKDDSKEGVKVGKYYYKKSTREGKKLMTKVNGKTIHFGKSDMQHYKDKTGIWSSKDHGDSKRRKNYLSRAKGIQKKDGSYAWKDPESANYHAVRILW